MNGVYLNISEGEVLNLEKITEYRKKLKRISEQLDEEEKKVKQHLFNLSDIEKKEEVILLSGYLHQVDIDEFRRGRPRLNLREWVEKALNTNEEVTCSIPVSYTNSAMLLLRAYKNLQWEELSDSTYYDPYLSPSDGSDSRDRKAVSQILIVALALCRVELEMTDEQIEEVIKLIEGSVKDNS